MYARSMSGREDWLQVESMIPFVRHEMNPAIADIRGNLGLYLLLDQHGRRYVIISGWETLEAMRGSDAAVAPLRAEAARPLRGHPEVAEWQVAALKRTGPLEPGSWVSVACMDADRAALDRVADAFRSTVVPAAVRLPGFLATALLVNRETGRVATAVGFDKYTSLHAARRKREPIHDLSSAGLVVTADAVADYELDIADIRLPESI
jgi:hypothetical protein